MKNNYDVVSARKKCYSCDCDGMARRSPSICTRTCYVLVSTFQCRAGQGPTARHDSVCSKTSFPNEFVWIRFRMTGLRSNPHIHSAMSPEFRNTWNGPYGVPISIRKTEKSGMKPRKNAVVVRNRLSAPQELKPVFPPQPKSIKL